MQKAERLIRTKLHLPFTRSEIVTRPRLHQRIDQGLRGPLTLITAPAGFGKTTLAASGIANRGMPAAWLSLDKDDNQVERFLTYLVAALKEAEPAIGGSASQLRAAARPVLPEEILTSLINDLDAPGREIVLVLDDYQFISSQSVHEAVAFLLEHCPKNFHLVITTRSDPPLPLTRMRARGQTVELRAGDLRFTEPEAAQFLNDIMGLRLDAGSVATLAARTEGWIAGLQMAALSMRDREDISGFIKGFSGTNRYILDYLVEEVLASQPPEIQHFLLHTSILGRLNAKLCDAILGREGSASILDYLERSNLFLAPLDDERVWYRYHHLFTDLLHTQLQKSFGDQVVAQLNLSASEWYEQNGLILDAIHHASLATDFKRIERLIEQNYLDMMNRGEMSSVRSWMGKLSREVVIRRPWLCLYEALSRSWFGQLEEANLYLDEAEKRIRSEADGPEAQTMLCYHAYVKSRVTAMGGDNRQAIALCRTASENISGENLGLQIDFSITLGYEYFLSGDFVNASRILLEMIRSGHDARAVNNPVAGYAVLARLEMVQGQLHEAYNLLSRAAQLIDDANGQYLGVDGLVEVGIAALLCEWNDLETALERLKRGLDLLPSWGKMDDLCLAYITLSRIQFARGNRAEAAEAIEKAAQIIQTCGVFSEARSAAAASQVKMWLAQRNWPAVDHWLAALEKRFNSTEPFRYEDELTHMARARVWLAKSQPDRAFRLLAGLEESARSAGRQGRLIEILILEALALQSMGEPGRADTVLRESLALAEPEGYIRVFLDEGQPLQMLLARWLAQTRTDSVRDYTVHLLSQFKSGPDGIPAVQEKASPAGSLVEPLSPRELEVLHLIALGRTNQEIASQLIVSPGTIKAHTASIYRKLDVSNRTEAVAVARELGIIP